jgi:ABC-type uncharacterized transport system YnjBCD permease subunit
MKKILPLSKFPHRLFSIVAIIAFVAFLLTLKPVAEAVKKVVEMLGITFPPMEMFRNTAANILLVALGYVALAVAAVIVVPIVKISLTLAAVAAVGYGLYNIYRTFVGGSTKDVMPDTTPLPKK